MLFFIVYIFFLILAIPLHEAGHLVFGLLSGYRFLSYRVFSFLWYKDGDKVSFQISKSSLAVGQCLLTPPENESDFKFILYNLGGGLANLLVAGVSLAIFLLADPGKVLLNVLVSILVANGVMGLMNLLPMKLSVPNDGMNVWAATRSKAATHGLYLMFRLNSDTMGGKRYSDYEESFFATDDKPDGSNYMAAYPLMCKAAWLYDIGKYKDSMDVYDDLDVEKLQPYYRKSVYADYVYYYSAHEKDEQKAREYFEKKGMAQLIHSDMLPFLRIRAAYEYFINDDRETGRRILEKAMKEAANNSNKGLAIMESEYLKRLEESMDNHEQGTTN